MIVLRKVINNLNFTDSNGNTIKYPTSFIGDGVELIIPNEIRDLVLQRFNAMIRYLNTLNIKIRLEEVDSTEADIYYVPIKKDSIIITDNTTLPYYIQSEVKDIGKYRLPQRTLDGVSLHPSRIPVELRQLELMDEQKTLNFMMSFDPRLPISFRAEASKIVTSFFQETFAEEIEQMRNNIVRNFQKGRIASTPEDIKLDVLKAPEGKITFICPINNEKLQLVKTMLKKIYDIVKTIRPDVEYPLTYGISLDDKPPKISGSNYDPKEGYSVYVDSDLTNTAKLAKFNEVFNMFYINGEFDQAKIDENPAKFKKLRGYHRYITTQIEAGNDLVSSHPFLQRGLEAINIYLANLEQPTQLQAS